ncbi:MAG: DUF5916 domain-containing protein [Acidobacteriota bacterium]
MLVRMQALGVLAFLCLSPLWSAAPVPPEILVRRTTVAPDIDGRLNDAAWEEARIPAGTWLTYNPVRGEQPIQETKVWMTYDDQNLYLAFRCLDPEPAKIKTSIARRDNIFNDDWVGLSLDSMFSGQSSYEMFVNPSGIQADILNSSASGEDVSPDWVWESEALRTEDGYTVEIRLPLQSIRFKSGSTVKMGVLFWRRVSRLGSSASWPVFPAGKSLFECHATAVFEDLNHPRTFELIPSVTYSWNQERSSPASWSSANSAADAGVSMKYGVTSSVTAEATVNPDFSQIESDSFQVEVNQRYPIFYSEKRPFFMEGMGVFSLAGAFGDSNMRSAVHTRQIIDPIWGMKLTGTLGQMSFGTLSAVDEAPRYAGEETNLPDGSHTVFNIGRALYSLGKGSYVGGIVTNTTTGDDFNRSLGSDISLRLGEHQEVTGTFLQTISRSGPGRDRTSGMAAQASFSHSTDRVNFITQLEHFDEDFNLDTAFYNRTGFSSEWMYAEYSFYPDKEKYPWLRKIGPMIWLKYGRDRIQGGHELVNYFGVNFRFTRQGQMRIYGSRSREPWAGREFWKTAVGGWGGAQLTNWLNVFASVRSGDGIYYDEEDPFAGKVRSLYSELSFQPTTRVNQTVAYDNVNFKRFDGSPVYNLHIVNARSTYQFNRNLAARAILQFDDSEHRILMDLLGSYEPVPGTVAYIGYGSLFEQREWHDGSWQPDQGSYLTTRRGLFFKVSYLQRF